VAKVKVGQPVTITFDAIAGKTFSGTVAVVTPLGTSTSGVVTFPVTVTFDPQGVQVPAGASATVTIIVARSVNAITVPSKAIKHVGTTTTVDVVGFGGAIESRAVQTGITGENGQVEIRSGLNEGDQVAVYTTTSATSRSSTIGTFGTGGGPGGPPR
jgi:multidrug efflux pump subunit AcrA (membrane-fusion protein)